MTNNNEGKEVKIKINKNNSDDSVATETGEMETAIPVLAKKKFFSFEKFSAFIFYAVVFLMPIFALPLVVAPIASSKAIIFYCGIFLAVMFFTLSATRKGTVNIPKSALLASSGLVALVWLASSLFSGNIGLSLLGKLYDTDTFVLILTSFLSLFLGSMIFQSEKRAIVFYLTLFCSAIVVFLFQFFHIVFGINIIPFNIFPQKTSNLIGSWSDFSIFFGLIGILALAFLETANVSKKTKFFLYIILLMSFLVMTTSNFFNNWIIFGFFSLFIFIITMINSRFANVAVSRKFIKVSFFAIIIALFFVLFRGTAGSLTDTLGVSFSEVRPSWQATINIAKQSLKTDVVLGTGPNTFLYNWLKLKPASINNTVFWNTRFLSGSGFLFSAMSTTGILGLVSIIVLFIVLLAQCGKVFFNKSLGGDRSLVTISLFGTIYLWTHIVLYSPGIFIFTMAFVFTGLFLALTVSHGIINAVTIDLSRKTKTAFVSMLIAVALLAGSAFAVYFFVQKFSALNDYSRAFNVFRKTGDVNKTKEILARAIKADKQDEYYRTLSELSLISLSQVLTDKNITEDKAVLLFRPWFDLATSSAQEAVKVNKADPANWTQLARVYESFISLKVGNASEAALGAYAEAFKVSPMDPSPFVSSARIVLQANKIDEARNYLQSALILKPDLTDALFMLSQIEAQAGNLKEAILKAEQSAISSPNNPGILFQLGLLNYQNKTFNNARLALESAVAVNKEYANARYFLGLVYDKQGEKSKAIEQFGIIQKTNPDNQEVKKILSNLAEGKNALSEVAPPLPEKRSEPPISEKNQTRLKGAKKK